MSALYNFNNDTKRIKINATYLDSVGDDNLYLSASGNYIKAQSDLDVCGNLRIYGNTVFAGHVLTDNSAVKIPIPYANFGVANYEDFDTVLTKTYTWISLKNNGYKVAYTPTSNKSNVYIHAKITFLASVRANQQISFKLMREVNGTATQCFQDLNIGNKVAAQTTGNYVLDYIDSPETENEVTYYLEFKIGSTNHSFDVSAGVLGFDSNNINCLMAQELYIPPHEFFEEALDTNIGKILRANQDASFDDVAITGQLYLRGEQISHVVTSNFEKSLAYYVPLTDGNYTDQTDTMFDVMVDLSNSLLTKGSDASFGDTDIDGTLNVDGNIYLNGSTITTSDARLKNNKNMISGARKLISQLSAFSYDKVNKIEDLGDSSKSFKEAGFIAQDINEIDEFKYLVHESENGEKILSLNYQDLFVYNLAATKELDEEVKKQKEEISLLKNKITNLTNKLEKLLAKE